MSTSATSGRIPELPGNFSRRRGRGHDSSDAGLQEVGYNGMIMPDHVPRIEGDSNGAQAFANAFGYIQAIIQLVNSEA